MKIIILFVLGLIACTVIIVVFCFRILRSIRKLSNDIKDLEDIILKRAEHMDEMEKTKIICTNCNNVFYKVIYKKETVTCPKCQQIMNLQKN